MLGAAKAQRLRLHRSAPLGFWARRFDVRRASRALAGRPAVRAAQTVDLELRRASRRGAAARSDRMTDRIDASDEAGSGDSCFERRGAPNPEHHNANIYIPFPENHKYYIALLTHTVKPYRYRRQV